MIEPRRAPGRVHVAALVALVALAAAAAGPSRPSGAAAAAATAATARAGPALDVVQQTPAVAYDGTFLLTLDVDRAPSGSHLDITLYSRLTDRAEYMRTLFGVGLEREVVRVPSVELDTVSSIAGRARRVPVVIGLRRGGSSGPGRILLSAGLSRGVYPLLVRLVDADGEQLAEVVTYLVRLPRPTDPVEPLATAVIVGLSAPPSVGPDGAEQLSEARLDALGAQIDALTRRPDVPLTLVPTPETVEALARRGGRAALLLTRLRRALRGRLVVDRPYVDVPLSAWVSAGMGEELNRQRQRGNAVLTQRLTAPDGQLWVADAALSTPAATRLWELGVRQVVVPEGSVARLPGAGDGTTSARPFELALPLESPLQAIQLDGGLQARATAGADPELGAYRLLAELAMIAGEDLTSPRGVVFGLSPSERPSTAFLTTLLDGLVANPMLRPATVDRVFAAVPPARAGSDGAVAERPLTPAAGPDLGTYPTDLAGLRATLASFEALVGPADPLLAGWQQRLLLSGSSSLSAPQQAAYLDSVRQGIEQRVASLDAPTRQTVTLTAREGRIPLTLRNRLARPVDVMVQLESSSRLEFPDGDRVPVRLRPGTRQLRLRVRTRSPGDSPLTVRVLSPDGGLEVTSTRLVVRSTAVSGLGVGLSIGAAGFLVVWWARHWRRARRQRRAAT